MPRRASKVPCPLGCGTAFWGQYALELHLLKVHEKCPHCNREFRRLPLHLKHAHPEVYARWVARASPDSEG